MIILLHICTTIIITYIFLGRLVYQEMFHEVSSMISSDKHLVGGTSFDSWTDRYSRRAFILIGITYHFINDDFQPVRILLDADGIFCNQCHHSFIYSPSVFPGSHTAERINKWVMRVFDMYHINRSRIHVTDNAAN